MRRKTFRNIHAVATFYDGEGQGTGQGAGQGQGAQGQPAAAAFDEARVNQIVNGAIKGLEAKLTKSIGDTITPLNEQLGGISELIKSLQAPPAATGQGSGSGSGSGTGDGKPDPQVTARLLEAERKAKTLESSVSQLQEENKKAKLDAEKMDRQSRIRAAVGQYQFVSDEAADTAFALMEQVIRRDSESGNLVGGPEGAVLPFDVFIKESLHGKHAYLLGTRTGGGMGAVKGDAKFAASGQMVGTTEMIKPGMRPEERAAVVAQIQAVGQALRGGH